MTTEFGVTVDPVSATHKLRGAKLVLNLNRRIEVSLQRTLRKARRSFRRGNIHKGLAHLEVFS